MDKVTKFWAIYYHILEKFQQGMTLAQASTIYAGEQLEAANYFDNYLKEQHATS